MTVSRANVEAILVKRAGPLMTKAGMAVTTAGSNADLNDPIGWSLRQTGYAVADPSLVADADLDDVADADLDEVLDLAEYRLLESLLGNLDDVDTRLGPRDEKLSQLAAQVEKRLARLAKQLQADYGYSVGALEAGVIIHEFVQHEVADE